MLSPFQVPLVAICTAPGVPSDAAQHCGSVPAAVDGISGAAHQLATRSETPPSSAETICQGGTCSPAGLAISVMPLLNVLTNGWLLRVSLPRPRTSV